MRHMCAAPAIRACHMACTKAVVIARWILHGYAWMRLQSVSSLVRSHGVSSLVRSHGGFAWMRSSAHPQAFCMRQVV